MTDSTEQSVQLRRLGRRTVIVGVQGTAPLIIHKFSTKARQMMLDAQQKKSKAVKPVREPERDCREALYALPDGRPGFPAVGFKAATIGAARYFDKKVVNMTMLRGAMFFVGEGPEQLVPIVGDWRMREDVVTVGISGTDLRFRPEFPEWSAQLRITFLPEVVTADSIVSLVDAGGMGGIGEWRPGKCATGSFGTFTVTDLAEVSGE
jgi:hypothetical protein